MANPYQQQSTRRKLGYFGIILILFTVALGVRRADTGFFRGIESQATDLQLREGALGEVELSGATVRLMMTGARGILICGLWWEAIDLQKKHEWNKLELAVKTLAKLQPHFTTPWLFQSWNLAYNVSVESDSPKDKFYYISRGIELIAEGERRNQGLVRVSDGKRRSMGNPDLRFNAGMYYQNKFGVSDEANTLRCLFQMSCIDPLERDPNQLRTTAKTVDREKFDAFCKKHPLLVRRLHTKLFLETPEDIVDFLAQNQTIPSRFVEPTQRDRAALERKASRLKAPEEQFPILAPFDATLPQYHDEYTPDQNLPDSFDNFLAAKGWYVFSHETLPEPDPKPKQFTPSYDPRKYRLPKSPALLIFRHYPARAQYYYGEHLEKDGWFDQPWDLNQAFPRPTAEAATGPLLVGQGDAREAWEKAYQLYLEHGTANGLHFDPLTLQNMQDKAQHYILAANVRPDEMPPSELPAELRGKGLDEGHDAYYQLYWLLRNHTMTNYESFLYRSEVERTAEAVRARRHFHEVERLRRAARAPEEIRKVYEAPDALPAWKKLLAQYPEFRKQSLTQEDNYEIQLKYLIVCQDALKARAKGLIDAVLLSGQCLARGALDPLCPERWLIPDKLVKLPPSSRARNAVLVVPVLKGPFEMTDEQGMPWIPAEIEQRVQSRMGMRRTVSSEPPAKPEEAGRK